MIKSDRTNKSTVTVYTIYAQYLLVLITFKSFIKFIKVDDVAVAVKIFKCPHRLHRKKKIYFFIYYLIRFIL